MSQAFVETPSGIALPVEEAGERDIERMLKQLDPKLMLVREKHAPSGQWVYAVYHYIAPDRAPLHVLYWTRNRKRDGYPLPLSTGIFYEVESRKQFAGRNLAVESREHNDAKRAEQSEVFDEELETEFTRYFRRRLRAGSEFNARRFFPISEKRVRRPLERLPRELRP